MKMLTMAALGFLVLAGSPSTAIGDDLDLEEQQTIARRVSDKLDHVVVDAVQAPLIVGISPIAVFRIRNNGKRSYTRLFSTGNYTFEIVDPDDFGVGQYICGTINQTRHELPRLEPKFLREVTVDFEASAEKSGVRIAAKVDGGEQLVREAFAAIRWLGDFVLSKRPAKFRVLIRGYADADLGNNFQGLLKAAPLDYRSVDALPPDTQDRTGLLRYQQIQTRYVVGNPFTNENLPELRARFFREMVVEPFLRDCTVAEVDSFLLKGKVSTQGSDPLLRKIDMYLYVY